MGILIRLGKGEGVPPFPNGKEIAKFFLGFISSFLWAKGSFFGWIALKRLISFHFGNPPREFGPTFGFLGGNPLVSQVSQGTYFFFLFTGIWNLGGLKVKISGTPFLNFKLITPFLRFFFPQNQIDRKPFF